MYTHARSLYIWATYGQSKRLNLITSVVMHISAGVMLPNSRGGSRGSQMSHATTVKKAI